MNKIRNYIVNETEFDFYDWAERINTSYDITNNSAIFQTPDATAEVKLVNKKTYVKGTLKTGYVKLIEFIGDNQEIIEEMSVSSKDDITRYSVILSGTDIKNLEDLLKKLDVMVDKRSAGFRRRK